MERAPLSDNTLRLYDAISEIRTKTSRSALVAHVKDNILALCGLSSFVFSVKTRGFNKHENFHSLVGCLPRWCQLYNAKHYYLNDPCIEYAMKNADPIPLQWLRHSNLTPGQVIMLDLATKYGFASGMVVPSHGPDKNRIGILFVGSGESVIREKDIWKYRQALRLVAIDLLSWTTADTKASFIDKFELSAIEIELLRLQIQGVSSSGISSLMSITKPRVDKTFAELLSRLNVSSRREAAHIADSNGVFT